MQSGCEIDPDHNSTPKAFNEADRQAQTPHFCCECQRVILPGETYRYESGIWDGRPNAYKTCVDCLSLRNTYYCSFIFGEIWSGLAERIAENEGEGYADSRLAKLTPGAREKVCELIEDAWLKKMAEDLTEKHLRILQHALGLDHAPMPYRNYYAAPQGSDNYAACCALVDMGFMACGLSALNSGQSCFRVTRGGYRVFSLENVFDQKERTDDL